MWFKIFQKLVEVILGRNLSLEGIGVCGVKELYHVLVTWKRITPMEWSHEPRYMFQIQARFY